MSMNKDAKKMEAQEAAKVIVQQIEEAITKTKGWHPQVYIGKTQDAEKREKEHLEENPPLLYFAILAEGSSQKISQLEKLCIEALSRSNKLQVLNKNGGGGGNPLADILYVAFSELVPGDDFGEYIDILIDNNTFPIQL